MDKGERKSRKRKKDRRVESLLKSKESGKDLASVPNLIKKRQLVEVDVNAPEDRIGNKEKRSSTKKRKNNRMKTKHQDRLNEENAQHQFLSDIEDEESWIQEKILLVSSDDYGSDLTGVQNLIKNHVSLEAEMAAHEPTIQALQSQTQSILGVPGMIRFRYLDEAWQELKQMTLDRGTKLNESLSYQNLLTKLEKEEEWISERHQLFNVEDYGDTTDAVEGVLQAFKIDYDAHLDRSKRIIIEGQQLIREGHTASITPRLLQFCDRHNALHKIAKEWKWKVEEYFECLQFMQEADAVGIWIAEKEINFRSEYMVGEEQYLLAKQETFDAGLAAFEKEGIQCITQLKDQILTDNHEHTAIITAIIKHHDDIMGRWHNLLAASKARKQNLLHSLEQLKKANKIMDPSYQLSEMIITVSPESSRPSRTARTPKVKKATSYTKKSAPAKEKAKRVESLLKSKESGKDLASVPNLIKKRQLVEADVNVLEDGIGIEEKRSSTKKRKKNRMKTKHQDRLNEENAQHQFLRDIEDEESWIQEKILLVSSDDYGSDLTGVQNLIKNHVSLEADLAAHEPTIQALQSQTQSILGVPGMIKMRNLNKAWQEFKQMTLDRGTKLNESLSYQIAISERHQLLNVEDYGDTTDAVEADKIMDPSDQLSEMICTVSPEKEEAKRKVILGDFEFALNKGNSTMFNLLKKHFEATEEKSREVWENHKDCSTQVLIDIHRQVMGTHVQGVKDIITSAGRNNFAMTCLENILFASSIPEPRPLTPEARPNTPEHRPLTPETRPLTPEARVILNPQDDTRQQAAIELGAEVPAAQMPMNQMAKNNSDQMAAIVQWRDSPPQEEAILILPVDFELADLADQSTYREPAVLSSDEEWMGGHHQASDEEDLSANDTSEEEEEGQRPTFKKTPIHLRSPLLLTSPRSTSSESSPGSSPPFSPLASIGSSPRFSPGSSRNASPTHHSPPRQDDLLLDQASSLPNCSVVLEDISKWTKGNKCTLNAAEVKAVEESSTSKGRKRSVDDVAADNQDTDDEPPQKHRKMNAMLKEQRHLITYKEFGGSVDIKRRSAGRRASSKNINHVRRSQRFMNRTPINYKC